MVAAQDIYIQTGDEKYIDQLLKNGVWTQLKVLLPEQYLCLSADKVDHNDKNRNIHPDA
ncbi:hypothetical protein [Pantoea stewartii]|uniref:hypothetical protein n=1 Tax=Pantoea stewartii TaxID=66269 RepID=UPI0024BEE41F|nr:hypothetical protein [Pantoea stewartii]